MMSASAGLALAPVLGLGEDKPAREWGTAKGKVWIADDFDGPLSQHVMAEFEK